MSGKIGSFRLFEGFRTDILDKIGASLSTLTNLDLRDMLSSYAKEHGISLSADKLDSILEANLHKPGRPDTEWNRYFRTELCGVGSRRVKLMLNKKSKDKDIHATIVRILLEIEDVHAYLKRYQRSFFEGYKNKYFGLLRQLIKIEKRNLGILSVKSCNEMICIDIFEHEHVQFCYEKYGFNVELQRQRIKDVVLYSQSHITRLETMIKRRYYDDMQKMCVL